MKKFALILLALVLMIPVFALAENPENLMLNYEAQLADYEGDWVLTGAYTQNDGMLEVAPEACTLEIKLSLQPNLLVDMEKYIHADVYDLQGTMSFNHEDIDSDDYRCSAAWDGFTNVEILGEGNCQTSGANRFKIRDDDEGVYFDILTGVELDEDAELMNVIGLNAEGNLIVGYSEDHIEKDEEAEWMYAYIFTKAEATEEAAE